MNWGTPVAIALLSAVVAVIINFTAGPDASLCYFKKTAPLIVKKDNPQQFKC